MSSRNKLIIIKNILSDTDGNAKPQPQSPCTFMQIFLYIILLTRNSRLFSKFPTIIVVISNLKKCH